jgi:hypothetical protein
MGWGGGRRGRKGEGWNIKKAKANSWGYHWYLNVIQYPRISFMHDSTYPV